MKNLLKFLLVFSLALPMFCGSANAQKEEPKKDQQKKEESHKDEASKSDGVKDNASKVEVRNNAASLLADLLGDEKNVSKILIIKHNSEALGKLMKDISKTAGDGADHLEALAKEDKSLNLHALELPPGEKATRAAIAKTKEHELLFTSGDKFELNLLLTQTDALDYGSHLAKIAAENSSSPEQQQKFHALDVALNALLERVVAQVRRPPAKK